MIVIVFKFVVDQGLTLSNIFKTGHYLNVCTIEHVMVPAGPTGSLPWWFSQGCHFSGISLISGKSEVPFHQANPQKRHVGRSKNLVSLFLAPDCIKLISRLKHFQGCSPWTPVTGLPLIFREKHFWPLTPVFWC